MSSLIERIKEQEKKHACNYYYDFVKKYCKITDIRECKITHNECKTIQNLIEINCNKPKAII